MTNKITLSWIILIITIFFFDGSMIAEEARLINFIREEKTLDEIITILKSSGKTGILYFTSKGCAPCKILQTTVFINDTVKSYVDSNFISFWINIATGSGQKLDKHYNINAVPTMVLTKNNGDVIDKIVGAWPPNKYLELLKKSLTGHDNILSLKEAYKADSNNKEVALKYADDLLKKYDYKSAFSIYENLIDKFEDIKIISKIYYNLGTCYLYTMNNDKAAELYIKGLEQNLFADKKDIVLGRVGRSLFEQKEYTSAIKYLEMVSDSLDYIPRGQEKYDTESSRYLIVLSYYKLGNIKKGKMILDSIFQKLYNAKNYMNMASNGFISIINNIACEDALPWVKKANELSEWKNSYALSSYSTLLAENRKYSEALEIKKKEIEAYEHELKKDYPEIYESRKLYAMAYLAALLIKSGDSTQGEKLIEDILNTTPIKYNALYCLIGSFLQYKVKLKESLEWAEEAIKLAPRESSMLLNIYANLLFENGNIQKAIEVATKVCEMDRYFRFKEDLEKFKSAVK